MELPRMFLILLAAGTINAITKSNSTIARTKFYFFYGPSYSDHQIYDFDQFSDIKDHEKYDENRTTVFYIHGYLETPETYSIKLMVSAYNTRNKDNFILLDWSYGASGDYYKDALQNVVLLGNKLATVFMSAFQREMNIKKFHVIGHSLGPHMAGYIGRNLIIKSNNTLKLPRITGLDPAYPGFYILPMLEYLSFRDAEFVDNIHTDAGIYGAPFASGSVDFWPNGGMSLQPGCPKRNGTQFNGNNLCSHNRSYQFYAESVSSTNKNTFLAVSARSWSRFRAYDTNTTNVINMGINCPTDVHGDYYLQTNGRRPFSRSIMGLRYSSGNFFFQFIDKEQNYVVY